MDGKAKQQIVERVKGATNILVTVSRNPSVDELSAALGLSLILNKLDKHATAVFSGQIPPAITFLEPKKTFENTVDSLRDFIIALNKEKADRLRYKVEDDVVRIFITPYKTTITSKDLQFSQGDFNVELIIALGVEKREDLDTAITAHGRILHDATVITINNKAEKNDLGSIDWQEVEASSLSEMIMTLSEVLQNGVVDEQISTALLTGIVSATARFSNTHTTPRVMTMAAQLMAAGANQQLIAARLEEGHDLPPHEKTEKDGTTQLPEGASKKVKKFEKKPEKGEMHITHDPNAKPESKDEPQPQKEQPAQAEATDRATEELDAVVKTNKKPEPTAADIKQDLEAAAKEVEQATEKEQKPVASSTQTPSWRDQDTPPALGGTLNATTEEAAEDKRREEEKDRNNIILTHDQPSLGKPMQPQAPLNAYSPGAGEYEPPTVDPFAETSSTPTNKKKELSIAELEAEAHAHAPKPTKDVVNDVRADIEKALNEAPFNPANQPVQSLGAQEMPTESEVTPALPAPQAEPDLALPPPPPMPDFSTLPPLPPMPDMTTPPVQETVSEPVVQQPPAAPEITPVTPPKKSDDPGEFKIPGQ